MDKIFLNLNKINAKNEIVGPEQLSEGSRPDGVHCARLEIDQNRPRHIFGARRFVVIHVDPLQLEVRVAAVPPVGLYAVLIRNDLPKLKRTFGGLGTGQRDLRSDLVAALTRLDMHYFAHRSIFKSTRNLSIDFAKKRSISA